MFNNITFSRKDIKLNILYTLLFIPIIIPDYFQSMPIVDILLTFMLFPMGIGIFYLTLTKKLWNPFILFVFIFFTWRTLTSYFLNNEPHDLVNTIRIMNSILLINYGVRYHTKNLLFSISALLSVYALLNFLTILAFPSGLYIDNPRPGHYREGWLFGINNQFLVFLSPAVSIGILHSWFKRKRISFWMIIVSTISLISTYYTDSATGLVSLVFIVFAVLMFTRNKKTLAKYDFKKMLVIYIIVWTLLVWMNSVEFFQTIFIEVLGRDMTLSGRTRIWMRVFEEIPNSPWYGYGINVRVLITVTYFVAHNMILQVILESGIVGLVLFSITVLLSGFKLQTYSRSPYAVIILVGIFSILIGGLTESYRFNYLYMLLMLGYQVEYIINSKKLSS